MTNPAKRVEDLPIFTELEDPDWGMDFHYTYDDLFARQSEGLMRLSSGELVVYTSADVGVLRANPAVSHQGLDHATAVSATSGEGYPGDMNGLRRLFAPSTFVRSGAEHRPGKQMISQVMSPRAVAALRNDLSSAVRSALDAAIEQGDVEFRTEVAEPVVVSFWRDAIGLDPEHTHEMIRLTADITNLFRTHVTVEDIQAGDDASSVFLETLAAQLKRNARAAEFPLLNDLVWQFASMDPSGRPDSPYEMLAAAMLDGFSTLLATQTLLAYTLLDAGVQPAEHRGDQDFATNAFMETLRLNSPVAMIGRQAIEDIDYDGLWIPKGTDLIFLWLVSGRDPKAFTDPNEFVLDRGNRVGQFSFGGGPYICGGRNVARIVGETLAAELADCGITIELAGEPTLGHDRTGRDVPKLPVRLRRA